MNAAETTSRWAMIWPFLLAGLGLLFGAYLRAVVFHGHGDPWLVLCGLGLMLVGLGTAVRRWTVKTRNRVARSLAMGVPILLVGRIVTWFLLAGGGH